MESSSQLFIAIFASTTRLTFQSLMTKSKKGDGIMSEQILNQILDELKSLNTRVDSIDSRLDNMDSRFDGVDSRLDDMDSRFNGIDSRLDDMDSRFNGIGSRLDDMDSRFNGIGSRFDDMDSRFNGIGSRFDDVDSRFNGIGSRFDDVDSRFNGIGSRFDRLDTELKDIKEHTKDIPAIKQAVLENLALTKQVDTAQASFERKVSSELTTHGHSIDLLNRRQLKFEAELES